MTPAQLKFLSGFLNGSVFTAAGKSYWDDLLREPPASSVQRFVAAGFLAPAPLAAKLDGKFKATEIKEFLRECRLPVSGRKDQCIERLVAADAAGMEAKVAGITAYVCTPTGKELAEQFLAVERERSRIARERSLQLLQTGDLRGALATVAQFERQQVFQRGVGVDWGRGPDNEDVERLRAILAARPRILRGVPDDQWRTAQVAAGMMHMWGERSARPWLPDSFVGASNLDRETTVLMVLFAGQTKALLAQLQRSTITKVQVLGSGDGTCPACRQLCRRKYRIDELPEVPYEHCTNDLGCRCVVVAAF
jgi:hypothetical protein